MPRSLPVVLGTDHSATGQSPSTFATSSEVLSFYAVQVVLQSPVQVALTIAPVITLIAPLLGAASFTLVLSPMLIATLLMSALVAVLVVNDGESTWFEGCALIALYCAIAASFWWG